MRRAPVLVHCPSCGKELAVEVWPERVKLDGFGGLHADIRCEPVAHDCDR